MPGSRDPGVTSKSDENFSEYLGNSWPYFLILRTHITSGDVDVPLT